MGAIPVTLSMLASHLSAILILGNAAEVYIGGFEFWLFSFGFIAATIVVSFTILPVLYDLKLTSAYEVNSHLSASLSVSV